MENTEFVMRMAERLLAVGISGLSIYLGYRLFLSAPTQTNQQGQIELPGMKVVLSRVGPGVFFAAFGAVILAVSYSSPVESTYRAADGSVTTYHCMAQAQPDDSAPTGASGSVQRRAKAINDIGLLNCAAEKLAADSKLQGVRTSLGDVIAEAKATLLRSVWDEEKWGAMSSLGARGLQSGAPDKLREVYGYVAPICPE